MKALVLVVVTFGLAGCSSSDFFGETTSNEAPPPATSAQPVAPPPASIQPATLPPPAPAPSSVGSTAPEASTSQPPAPVSMAPPPAPSESEPPAVTAARAAPAPSATVNAHCKNLAKLRASDAAFQGEDPDTQKAVYNGTYRNCVAWDAAHRS